MAETLTISDLSISTIKNAFKNLSYKARLTTSNNSNGYIVSQCTFMDTSDPAQDLQFRLLIQQDKLLQTNGTQGLLDDSSQTVTQYDIIDEDDNSIIYFTITPSNQNSLVIAKNGIYLYYLNIDITTGTSTASAT